MIRKEERERERVIAIAYTDTIPFGDGERERGGETLLHSNHSFYLDFMFSTTCSMSLPGAAEIRSCFQLKNRLEWNLRRHGPRPQIAEASPYLHSWRRKTCQEFRKAWYIHKLTYYICIYIYINIADILVVWICSKQSIEYHDGVRYCSMRLNFL